VNQKLLDTYLKAVKTFLPKDQQDDIAQELSDDILSRVDAQEAELGRPLTEAEQEAVLKRLGHPALLAGRYRADNRSVSFGRQLIGPELFPLYIRVLAISLGVSLLGGLIGRFAFGALMAEAWPGLVWYALAHFALVTAIFTAAQTQLTRHPDRWDPRDPLTPPPAAKDPQVVSRTEVIIELVIISAILLWLRSLAATNEFALGELSLTPVWRQIYLAVVLLNLASLAPPAVNLFQPRWMTFRLASKVVLGVAWLGLMAYLYQAGPWVSLVAPAVDPKQFIATLNQYIGYGLLITIAFSALELAYEAYRLARHLRRRPEAVGITAAVV
jgi:hypothetical protein